MCPCCSLNNRQRAMAHVILDQVRSHRAVSRDAPARMYLMEQITPIFRLLSER
jgi:hypothetical protein